MKKILSNQLLPNNEAKLRNDKDVNQLKNTKISWTKGILNIYVNIIYSSRI